MDGGKRRPALSFTADPAVTWRQTWFLAVGQPATQSQTMDRRMDYWLADLSAPEWPLRYLDLRPWLMLFSKVQADPSLAGSRQRPAGSMRDMRYFAGPDVLTSVTGLLAANASSIKQTQPPTNLWDNRLEGGYHRAPAGF